MRSRKLIIVLQRSVWCVHSSHLYWNGSIYIYIYNYSRNMYVCVVVSCMLKCIVSVRDAEMFLYF